MRRTLCTMAAALVLLSGCSMVPAPTEPAPVEPFAPPANGQATDAVELIDLWRVAAAHGTGPDSFLRLEGTDLIAWTDCGVAMGSWRASGTAFIADIWGESAGSACLGDAETRAAAPSLDWLYVASRLRITADGAELLDRDGDTVAVLSVDGAPPSNPNMTDDYLERPERTDADATRLAAPAPLPNGIVPAATSDLTGRWEPEGSFAPETPFAEFHPDGTWSGSDGCNGGGGRWSLGDGGVLLATSGVSTLIGCDGLAVPSLVATTGRAGIVDGKLVLVDASGVELQTLARA
jgi:hypothetical protein